MHCLVWYLVHLPFGTCFLYTAHSVIPNARRFIHSHRSRSAVFSSAPTAEGWLIDNLEKFANLCAKEHKSIYVDYKHPESWFEQVANDSVTEVNVMNVTLAEELENATVKLLVLPRGSGLSWPTFFESKQGMALGKGIVLERSDPLTFKEFSDEHELLREKSVEDILFKERKSVALVGHPGIGKSLEINKLLLPVFRALQNGTLNNVYQRAKGTLFHYRMQEGKICCELVPGAGKTLDTLEDYFSVPSPSGKIDWSDSMLVLELEEDEKDPDIDEIPFIVAVPSGEAKETLKTLDKGDSVRFVPRPLHTKAELAVLATALYHGVAGASLCADLNLPTDALLADVLQVVQHRIDTISPLARLVLGPQVSYDDWCKHMDASIEKFLRLDEVLDVYRLPHWAKYFVTPAPDGRIAFLSNTAMQAILHAARAEHVARIRRRGLDWQLAEEIFIEYYLLHR